MFSRVLYIDESVALELKWLGLGALQVQYRNGGVRRAHPVQKQYFLAVVKEFEAAGQPVNPANPRCSRLFKEFAHLLEHPATSLTWETLFRSSPRDVARAYADVQP
jgi:hypothetical protein